MKMIAVTLDLQDESLAI